MKELYGYLIAKIIWLETVNRTCYERHYRGGFSTFTVFFLEFQMVERYELMVQHARGVIKTYEGTLRFLDESDKELVQLEEGYNKMIEYLRASN